MTINILGTKYTITFRPDEEVCSAMSVQIGECGGYCSAAAKEIVIANLDRCDDADLEKDEVKRCNLRHEIVHAFLNESGLQANSNGAECWAKTRKWWTGSPSKARKSGKRGKRRVQYEHVPPHHHHVQRGNLHRQGNI